MDNNILIKITSEANLTDAQKQLADLRKRAEDLEIEMSQMQTAYENEMAAIKKSNKTREEQAAELLKLKQRYRDIKSERKAEAKEVNQSIKAISDSVKAYKTLHGQSGKVVQQLRAMREELQRMEDAGEFGSKSFTDLAIAAAKLEDQIGDTQQRIRVLASDTKYMDAAMGLGEGLAGSFYIATSAAEVFGDDMEGLQQAFYKVQAAMSVLSGSQQLFNALQKDSSFAVVFGNGLEKTKQKLLQRSTALERLYNIQKKTGTTLTGAQSATTGLWTKAQWKLNAAIAANPIGAVLTTLLALGAAVFGIIAAYDKFFSKAGKAQMELEKIQAENGANQAKRTHDHEQNLRKIDNAETQSLAGAKARHASEIEMSTIKSKYAKQRAKETEEYTNKEIKLNNKEVEQYKILMEEAQKEADSATTWFGRKKRKLKELAEAQENYYNAVKKTEDLEQQNTDAQQAASDAAQDLAESRQQMALEAEQANIDLMKDGAAKEIAQINLNYREKLKKIQGNSKEETALRKDLMEKQAKEIADVQKKYDQQAQQVALQEMKNLLKAKSQSRGTEADYAQEIALTKAVAEQEAQARVAALDKERMSEDDYKAQVEAIRLELADTLKQIDDDEANRKAENARRLTDIELKEAEARKNALTGAEGVDEQKAILEDYYATRKKQIEENARLEKEAVERSKDTEEVKAAKIEAINAQLNADLESLRKEGAQAMLDVDSQHLADLELAVSKSEDAINRAQGGDKIGVLKEHLDAQLSLYSEQQKQLKAQYDAGLISFKDYKAQEWEITKATTDAEVEYIQEATQTITDAFQMALDNIQQVSDLVFEALGNNVQAELDALDEEYTTDWEEAQKSADKKYITEKEYEKKKAALEMKQAKYAKTQALINAAINTALGITQALATTPFPLNIPMAALVAGMGAAQIAIIASKPLSQYEKGRKGGKGEYAIVGEKGPEIMYVPEGASIVPNNVIAKPEDWSKFGVPELPHADPEILYYTADRPAAGEHFDYDRMGAAVALHLPKQRNVTVNVDRTGVHVLNGGDNNTYLNTKYTGSWH